MKLKFLIFFTIAILIEMCECARRVHFHSLPNGIAIYYAWDGIYMEFFFSLRNKREYLQFTASYGKNHFEQANEFKSSNKLFQVRNEYDVDVDG